MLSRPFGSFGHGVFDLVDRHLGIGQDVVERGHLLMTEVCFNRILVPFVANALLKSYYICYVLKVNIDLLTHSSYFLI